MAVVQAQLIFIRWLAAAITVIRARRAVPLMRGRLVPAYSSFLRAMIVLTVLRMRVMPQLRCHDPCLAVCRVTDGIVFIVAGFLFFRIPGAPAGAGRSTEGTRSFGMSLAPAFSSSRTGGHSFNFYPSRRHAASTNPFRRIAAGRSRARPTKVHGYGARSIGMMPVRVLFQLIAKLRGVLVDALDALLVLRDHGRSRARRDRRPSLRRLDARARTLNREALRCRDIGDSRDFALRRNGSRAHGCTGL